MSFPPNFTGLSAIVVSHNSEAFLGYCLSSLQSAFDGFDGEIIVVDNASKINPSHLMREKYPNVRWQENDQNLGFGKACNQGADLAKYSHLLFVNPDTLIPSGSLRAFLQNMSTHTNLGLCGCKILNPDGSLQRAARRSFPTPIAAIGHLLRVDSLWPESRIFGQYNMTYIDDSTTIKVDAVSGSFFCVGRDVYESVNGFDEDFFLYGEDLDLSFRVQAAGFVNSYFPQTHVVHVKGHSSKSKPWFSYFHFYLAMLVFVRKHKSRIGVPLFLLQLGVVLFGLSGAIRKILPSQKILTWVLPVAVLLGALGFYEPSISLYPALFYVLTLVFLNSIYFNTAFKMLGLFLICTISFWAPQAFLGVGLAALLSLSFFAKKTFVPILAKKKRVAWIFADSVHEKAVVPDQVDVVLALRNDADFSAWKVHDLIKVLQFDELWMTGDVLFDDFLAKIPQELRRKQKEFIVISEPYGLLTKLELNLVGTSLNLSKAT